LCASRERREKRAEWVALGRNFIISLGMPSGPGALLCRDSGLFYRMCRVLSLARVTVGSPQGVIAKGSGLSVSSNGGMGRRGGSGEFIVEVGVDHGDNVVGGVYYRRVGAGDLMYYSGGRVIFGRRPPFILRSRWRYSGLRPTLVDSAI
jgi:hypothetical protein